MTKKLTRDTVFYAFSADLEPALEIEPGEKVQMETHDCFCGQMQTEADTVETLDWERVNPATGPVYIRRAQPGDILAVDIEDVQVADQGARERTTESKTWRYLYCNSGRRGPTEGPPSCEGGSFAIFEKNGAGDLRSPQPAVNPPSMISAAPVTKAESSVAR